jgi:hypothetical protein
MDDTFRVVVVKGILKALARAARIDEVCIIEKEANAAVHELLARM